MNSSLMLVILNHIESEWLSLITAQTSSFFYSHHSSKSQQLLVSVSRCVLFSEQPGMILWQSLCASWPLYLDNSLAFHRPLLHFICDCLSLSLGFSAFLSLPLSLPHLSFSDFKNVLVSNITK